MKNQFVKIKLSPSGTVRWLNVDNIVAIEKFESNGTIKLITNAKRDDHPVFYTVKSSVEEFLSAIGGKEIVLP